MNAKEIFLRAVDGFKPSEWPVFLAGACGDNAELRHEVDELLNAHQQQDSLFDVAPTEEHVAQPLGESIGRYKLLQKIGEGGFGVVYMAEQVRPVRRNVALKIIKPGMDSKEVIARFEAERQALAMMDHPNISKVLDGGETESGHPYFVMELVKGIPFTKFCDENKLDTCSRLQLFKEVCNAIQHAHQKGVIHRDIKPSNVMVTLHDGKPVPKVIDFGVSKAISQQLTAKTLFTAYGQMVGTPQYMSPEQAELSGLDIDTRSDIYSLGVLLYELLTGTTPLDPEKLRQTAYAELQRMIREDEPPKPSRRLSTMGEQTAKIAANRGSSLKSLCSILKGELDWIVMKALDKDRNRRYDTAKGFALDIDKYLSNEPVSACPPSSTYLLRKMFIRNRKPAIVASIFVTVLLVGLLSTTSMWLKQRSAYELAERRWTETEQAKLEAAAAERKAAERAGELEKQLYQFHVLQAGDAARELKLDAVRYHLEQCPVSLRSWEWDRLDTISSRSRFISIDGRERPLFANGGDVLVTCDAGADQSAITVWNAASGEFVRSIAVGNHALTMNAIHPDGKLIAVTDDGNNLTLVDWTTNKKRVMTSSGHQVRVDGLEFTPDGSKLVSVGWDGAIRVRDSQTLELKNELQLQDSLRGVQFDPSGRHFVTASGLRGDGSVKVYATDSLERIASFPSQGSSSTASTFSHDGKLLAYGNGHGVVSLVDTSSWQTVSALSNPGGRINAVQFSPNDSQMAVSSSGCVKLWDLETKTLVRQLSSSHKIAYWVAFSPSGNHLASFGFDVQQRQSTCLYDIAADDPSQLTLHGLNTSHAELAFSPMGNKLAAGGPDRVVKIWDTFTGQELDAFYGHCSTIVAVAWGRSGSQLFSHDLDGRLISWDLQKRKPLWSQRIENHRVTGRLTRILTTSADGSQLLVALQNGNILTLDARDGRVLGQFQSGARSELNGLDCSPDGRWIAAARNDGAVILWDANSKELQLILEHPGTQAIGTYFSSDGTHLAASFMSQPLLVWQLDKPLDAASESQEFVFPAGGAWDICFSKDGTRIMAVGGLNTQYAYLWDLESNKTLFEWQCGELAYSMVLHPHDDAIAQSGNNGAVKLFFARRLEEESLDKRDMWTRAAAALEAARRECESTSQCSELLRENRSLNADVLDAALQLNIVRGENPYTLARNCWKILVDGHMSEYEQALSQAQRASQLAPDCYEYTFLVGRILYCMGHYSDALDALSICQTLPVNDPRTDIWDPSFDLRVCLLATQALVDLEFGNRESAERRVQTASELLKLESNMDQTVRDIFAQATKKVHQHQ